MIEWYHSYIISCVLLWHEVEYAEQARVSLYKIYDSLICYLTIQSLDYIYLISDMCIRKHRHLVYPYSLFSPYHNSIALFLYKPFFQQSVHLFGSSLLQDSLTVLTISVL